jgi:hypothetical protein
MPTPIQRKERKDGEEEEKKKKTEERNNRYIDSGWVGGEVYSRVGRGQRRMSDLNKSPRVL